MLGACLSFTPGQRLEKNCAGGTRLVVTSIKLVLSQILTHFVTLSLIHVGFEPENKPLKASPDGFLGGECNLMLYLVFIQYTFSSNRSEDPPAE